MIKSVFPQFSRFSNFFKILKFMTPSHFQRHLASQQDIATFGLMPSLSLLITRYHKVDMSLKCGIQLNICISDKIFQCQNGGLVPLAKNSKNRAQYKNEELPVQILFIEFFMGRIPYIVRAYL